MKRIISIVLVLAICCGMFAVMATASGKFTDVPDGEWYTEAVTWAVDNEITNGTGNDTFTPDGVCTRAQIVTFLWRSFDRPYGNYKNIEFTFDDVPNSFYYPAVKWAITFDITNGVGEKRFAPEAFCTRAQIVTFLWRAVGCPKAAAKVNFTDVRESDYFYEAVQWAVENGVTNGMGKNTFCPEEPCTRAQVVTFLYRAKEIISSYKVDAPWVDYTPEECPHSDIDEVYDDFKCTEDSILNYVCRYCGEVIRSEVVPATGHAWVTDDNGNYDSCMKCGMTWEEYQNSTTEPTDPAEPTEPTGCKHNWVETNHPEEGHYELHVTCDCGAVFQAVGVAADEMWKTHALEEESKATNATELAAIVSQHCGSSSYEVRVVDRAAYTTTVCSICGEVWYDGSKEGHECNHPCDEAIQYPEDCDHEWIFTAHVENGTREECLKCGTHRTRLNPSENTTDGCPHEWVITTYPVVGHYTHRVLCCCGWAYEGYGACDYSHLEELWNKHVEECKEKAALSNDPELIRIENELHRSGQMFNQEWVMDRNVFITIECSICGAAR